MNISHRHLSHGHWPQHSAESPRPLFDHILNKGKSFEEIFQEWTPMKRIQNLISEVGGFLIPYCPTSRTPRLYSIAVSLSTNNETTMLSTHNNMVKRHSTCSKVKRRALPASCVPGVHVLRCHQQPHLGERGSITVLVCIWMCCMDRIWHESCEECKICAEDTSVSVSQAHPGNIPMLASLKKVPQGVVVGYRDGLHSKAPPPSHPPLGYFPMAKS